MPWILDIGGARLVIDAMYMPATDAAIAASLASHGIHQLREEPPLHALEEDGAGAALTRS
jgi:hypothetical protein